MDNVITTTATALLDRELPSRIAMPTCGHAQSEWTRVRSVKGAVKGDMGFAVAYLPGNPAWRPPKS